VVYSFHFLNVENMRSGGAIRGKWRIPDGKVESGKFLYLEL
jgi:hypothetical protein